MVLLFSSDYYPVFKKDIFAIASLPIGYGYHFRYPSEYVSDTIKKAVKDRKGDNKISLENAPAIVIFVTGNTDTLTTHLNFISIRFARIIDVKLEDDTDLYHVYFQLLEFTGLDAKQIEAFKERPQQHYLGWEVVKPTSHSTSWFEIIRRIDKFGNGLFFHFNIQDVNGKDLAPKFEERTHQSYFEITEGKAYSVKLSIADSNANKEENEIRTVIEGTDIKSNIGASIQSGLDRDNRIFKLTGLLLGDISSPVNLIKISSIRLKQGSDPESSNYSVRILFNVVKDSHRFLKYLGLSALVVAGGAMLTLDFSKFVTHFPIILTIKLTGLVITSFAAASLFFLFNKK